MNIGFDAKRLFFNPTGLGSYARSLVRALVESGKEHRFFLYTPREPGGEAQAFWKSFPNVALRFPPGPFSGLWRSFGMKAAWKKDRLGLYHGLSNEIPFGVRGGGVKTVVTIHDLIFLKYKPDYRPLDRAIYRFKTRYACAAADGVVADSEETKADIVRFYGTLAEKITVVYPPVDPRFLAPVEPAQCQVLREKYGLPEKFILFVATLSARKNLMALAKALDILRHEPGAFLAVAGRPTAYRDSVTAFLETAGLSSRVKFLGELPSDDLPALYRSASVFVYPSLYEGFGIPIIEALACGTPVVTTRGGCFEEAGGTAALYADPRDPRALAERVMSVFRTPGLRERISREGPRQAARFGAREAAAQLMEIYERVMTRRPLA